MRRYVLLAAAAPILAVTAAVSVPGCAEEFENICVFLQDPNSCYQKFHAEADARCGARGKDSGPIGNFASRETLDVCFLEQGGQVVFDPPLDLAAFPLQSIKFTRLDSLAKECGTFTYSGEFTYSVTINPCSDTSTDTELARCTDRGEDGTGTDSVDGGTLTLTTPEGRDTLDVTCAGSTPDAGAASSHHFNRIDIAECAKESQDNLLPKAEIESSPGHQPPPDEQIAEDNHNFDGFVKFRILHPKAAATISSGSIAEPDVVEYFNCRIPPPSPLCFNGQKDGLETDVDCGGELCDAKCGDGKSCVSDGDCALGGECVIENGLSICKIP
ncbi:hypothetical protein [Sorangium sp. So ce1099]|uniref:hypothetical protein n=1 Tax=Sorangium sp. So ce1099 TaxID=3133331 RepID=UPI003F6436E8